MNGQQWSSRQPDGVPKKSGTGCGSFPAVDFVGGRSWASPGVLLAKQGRAADRFYSYNLCFPSAASLWMYEKRLFRSFSSIPPRRALEEPFRTECPRPGKVQGSSLLLFYPQLRVMMLRALYSSSLDEPMLSRLSATFTGPTMAGSLPSSPLATNFFLCAPCLSI